MASPADPAWPQDSEVFCEEVAIELRGGHSLSLQVPENTPLLRQLKRLRGPVIPPPDPADPPLLQLPLGEGREALAVSVADLVRVRFPRAGEHPLMNRFEGHLGGYISGRHPRSEELGMEHGDSATWTPQLWRWIQSELGVDSVLDVGCGEGHAAEYFQQLGCRICGIDGSKLALRDSLIPERHVLHDYTTGPYLPDEDYDLVWSCEFVEHVEARYADNFLATFGAAGKYLFMTAAPPGQMGWHHVNCQLPEYWVDRIEPLGFRFDLELSDHARQIAGSGHFSRTGLVFVREP